MHKRKRPTKKQRETYDRLRAQYKKIEEYTDYELDAVIAVVSDYFGHEFWMMLNGIDAYFEKRDRKRKIQEELAELVCQEEIFVKRL